jgi:hypothetical protein
LRMEQVSVLFAFRDLDEYESWVMEVAGPFAMLVRGLPKREREASSPSSRRHSSPSLPTAATSFPASLSVRLRANSHVTYKGACRPCAY